MTGDNRLLAYRHLEQINQQELAAELGCAASTVSAMESQRRPLNLDPGVLGYSIERLTTLPSMSEPMHRARASTRVTSRRRAKEILRLAGEVYGALASATAKAPRPRLERLGPIGPESTDLEEAAYELRVGVLDQEEDAPIGNLTRAIERAGIVIVPIHRLPGVDGLSSWIDSEDLGTRIPVIGVDPSVPGDRLRLTLLHEVCHLAHHARPGDATESEANRFARTVLVPDTHVYEMFATGAAPTLRDFVAMKRRWGISVAALIYGAHEMGLIDDHRYRSLQIQKAPWRKNEPERFDPVPGELLPALVDLHGGPTGVGDKLGIPAKHVLLTSRWTALRAV